jgi:hypothetical protein
MPVSQQLQNVAGLFASDNNGVMIQLPSVPMLGAATASGYLVFGIGTQSNNPLGSATVFPADPSFGSVDTTYKGTVGPSVVDSGTSVWFFDDTTITQCTSASGLAGFYCPASVTPLTFSLQGSGGSPSVPYSFSIANATTLFNTGYAASALGAPAGGSALTPGLPFFYGRRVFVGIEGTSAAGHAGPFFAATTP